MLRITAEDVEERRDTDPNAVSGQIVDSAIKVHSALGPGLLASAYQACLSFELRRRGLRVQQQLVLPIIYEGERIDAGYRIDLLVEHCVIIEIKAIQAVLPIHEAQLLSYLRLSGQKVRLLLNFHVPHMRDGVKRMVNAL
ncbi:MAG: GxxExxY protein [Gemmatimonadota bacterium]